MLSARSYAEDMRHYSSEDEDQLDDDRDRGCFVVWKSTSVLETYPALLPPPALRRSGAPEPSSATGTTPRTKRTTTNAALPSPSSVAVDESGSAERSLDASTSSSSSRQAKKRRNISSRRAAVAARQAMTTSAAEPLDARTLEMVTQLSKKIQAKTAAAAAAAITTPRQTSVSGSRAAPSSGSGGASSANGSRNVGKNGVAARSGTAVAQPRSPLRQSMLSTNATCALGTTPLRQTPARMARQQQQTLSLSATKATLFATSKAIPSYGNKAFDAAAIPEAKVASPQVLVPPTPTYGSTTLASIANDDRGDAVQPTLPTVAIDDDEDYFEGDASFELALSQVDDKSLVPSQPAAVTARSLPKTGAVPARRPYVAASVASHAGPVVAAARKDAMPTVAAARSVRAPSPRVKGPSIGTAQAAQPSVKPLGSAAPSTGTTVSVAVRSGPLAAPMSRPFPAAVRPDANSLPSRQTTQRAALPAAATAATKNLRSNLASGHTLPKTAATFVVRTSGSSRLKTSASAGKDRLAMEELAREEIEALEMMGEEEGSMLWDDDDF